LSHIYGILISSSLPTVSEPLFANSKIASFCCITGWKQHFVCNVCRISPLPKGNVFSWNAFWFIRCYGYCKLYLRCFMVRWITKRLIFYNDNKSSISLWIQLFVAGRWIDMRWQKTNISEPLFCKKCMNSLLCKETDSIFYFIKTHLYYDSSCMIFSRPLVKIRT